VSSQSNKANVVAVWSGAGSVGRSAIAAAIACELTRCGKRVLIIDADVYAPSLVQIFGFDQTITGLSSAIRLQNQSHLDQKAFANLLLDYEFDNHSLKILAGLSMVNGWPQLSFDAVRTLLTFCQTQFDFIVLDLASAIETSLVDRATLTERNSATLASLSMADHILAITNCDVVSLNRFFWASTALKDLRLNGRVHVIANRLGHPATGKCPPAEIAQTIRNFAELPIAAFIDDDPSLFGRSVAEGLPISEVRKNSSVKQAIRQFVFGQLLELPSNSRRHVAKLG
jgi:MinD-like ATPase involved in chromosome partitioning or flagellar assembly